MTDSNRTFRKTRTGVVTSDLREKTVTVSIEIQFPHPKYKKIVKKLENYTHMMRVLRQKLEIL